MLKKLLFAAMLAASTIGLAPPAVARYVVVQTAPPPLRVEAVPAPRVGYVWVPGYWDWRGHRHVWVGGLWVRHRPGYRYYKPRWVERGGRWSLERGRWGRGDRDHDGVANRRDRYPNNPHRH